MIYVDANVVIRLVEGDGATRRPLELRLASAFGTPHSLVTSRLALLECRSKPTRLGDATLLSLYDEFFASAELLIFEVSAAVIGTATELRAK